MSRKRTKAINQEMENQTTASPGQVEQTDLVTETRPQIKPKLSEEEEYQAIMRAVVSETRYGVVYNARYVNVRDAASPVAAVIRIADEGERVIIIYEDNGFYKVQFQDKTEGFISTDFIKEIHGGDSPDDFFVRSESILTSVKKLLGIDEECEEFDLDVLMNINAAIFTLRQLGVGPADGFTVTNKNATYSDYLGEDSKETPEVKMYLFYKTKLGFDPPQSSYVMEAIKQMISEAEWRLNAQVDPPDAFEEGGEISK